ncbi:MAG: hypothetical protein U5K31_09295 [Balneolaceae bacterium]|nr:hypothetical protein [Balneolaceae bacterium]
MRFTIDDPAPASGRGGTVGQVSVPRLAVAPHLFQSIHAALPQHMQFFIQMLFKRFQLLEESSNLVGLLIVKIRGKLKRILQEGDLLGPLAVEPLDQVEFGILAAEFVQQVQPFLVDGSRGGSRGCSWHVEVGSRKTGQ